MIYCEISKYEPGMLALTFFGINTGTVRWIIQNYNPKTDSCRTKMKHLKTVN